MNRAVDTSLIIFFQCIFCFKEILGEGKGPHIIPYGRSYFLIKLICEETRQK